jgi:hypothetical protein
MILCVNDPLDLISNCDKNGNKDRNQIFSAIACKQVSFWMQHSYFVQMTTKRCAEKVFRFLLCPFYSITLLNPAFCGKIFKSNFHLGGNVKTTSKIIFVSTQNASIHVLCGKKKGCKLKIENFNWKWQIPCALALKRQNPWIWSSSAYALEICHFCMNFCKIVLHPIFCHKVCLWMHCGYASLQVFIIFVSMIF